MIPSNLIASRKEVQEAIQGFSIPLRALGPQARFYFACRVCGECCRDRHHGLSNGLSGFDVARAAQHLGITTMDFTGRFAGIEIAAGSQSWFQVALRQVDDHCVFLEADGTCGIHQAKPVVCQLAPLGLVMARGRVGFVIPRNRKEWCPGLGQGRAWTVERWLADSVDEQSLLFMLAEVEMLEAILGLQREIAPGVLRVKGWWADAVEELLFNCDLLVERDSRLTTLSPVDRYKVGLANLRALIERHRTDKACGNG